MMMNSPVQTAEVLKAASEAQRTIEQLKLQKEQAILQVCAARCMNCAWHARCACCAGSNTSVSTDRPVSAHMHNVAQSTSMHFTEPTILWHE
jgi:hypothetical protein